MTTEFIVTVQDPDAGKKVTLRDTSSAVVVDPEHLTVIVEKDVVDIVDIAIQGPPGAGTSFNEFEFTLTSGMLANEISPGVIRVSLPGAQTLAGATSIEGYIDGRYQKLGYGWQPSQDNLAVEIYVPTDSTLRARYLAAQVDYAIKWTS